MEHCRIILIIDMRPGCCRDHKGEADSCEDKESKQQGEEEVSDAKTGASQRASAIPDNVAAEAKGTSGRELINAGWLRRVVCRPCSSTTHVK